MGSILCPHVVQKGSVASLSPHIDAELRQPVSAELKQSAAYCRIGKGRQWILASSGLWLGTKYFKMAAWAGLAFFKQSSVILPKPNNFFESRCREKNHYATSSKLNSLGSLCFHLLLALYRT